jgi:hypothetical protein
VYGSGFTFTLTSPFKGLYVSGCVLWEYGARSTFQGRTSTLSAGLAF